MRPALRPLRFLLSLLPLLFSAPSLADTAQIPGKFVWADLVTHDAATAQQFYHAWLGWNFRPAGDVQLITLHDRTIGTLRQRATAPDNKARPRWIGYVSVTAVDAASKRVVDAGGQELLPQQNDALHGDFALVADAENALFGLIKRPDGDPEDYLAEPGEWIWMQLFTRNPGKAATFYQQVGNYELYPLDGDNNRQLLVKDGYARAALSRLPDAQPDLPPTWLPFLRVGNIEQAIARVKTLGGKILLEPNASRMDGNVAIIADPTGAAVGILEWQEDNSQESKNAEVAP